MTKPVPKAMFFGLYYSDSKTHKFEYWINNFVNKINIVSYINISTVWLFDLYLDSNAVGT